MAEGRERAEWWRLANLMALLDNLQPFRSSRPASKPSDFDAYGRRPVAAPEPPPPRVPVSFLVEVLKGGR